MKLGVENKSKAIAQEPSAAPFEGEQGKSNQVKEGRMEATIRVAHLSDLHIGFLSKYPLDWLSKGIIAQLNYLLRIHRRFQPELLETLPKTLQTLDVDWVLISGDFTTAGNESEFLVAREFLEKLQNCGLRLLLIPGNHDHYTERKESSGFYRYIYPLMKSDRKTLFSDRSERCILTKDPSNPWEIWLLDQTEPTPWISSQGIYDAKSASLLSAKMSSEAKRFNAIMCGHFPLHNSSHRLRELLGRRILREVLSKKEQVRIYAHGHTHQHHIFDERPKRGAISSDSGSLTQRGRGGFNIYELKAQGVNLRRFWAQNEPSSSPWIEGALHHWSWP